MLHLVKLCVGFRDVAGFRRRIERMAFQPGQGMLVITRSTPKRREELLPGGSLYWVVSGAIRMRQELLDLQPVPGDDGITRCGLVLSPEIVETTSVPYKAFQGWRYLDGDRAPPDMGDDDLPDHLRAALSELGLA